MTVASIIKHGLICVTLAVYGQVLLMKLPLPEHKEVNLHTGLYNSVGLDVQNVLR